MSLGVKEQLIVLGWRLSFLLIAQDISTPSSVKVRPVEGAYEVGDI